MSACLVCRHDPVSQVLDVGPQPVASHFLAAADDAAPTHPIAVGVCPRCELVQLIELPAPELLVPPYAWITANEPEGHLDRLAGLIDALAGDEDLRSAAGATWKDESLLDRLAERGFARGPERAGVVVARQILEHQPDPLAFLAGLRSSVVPGGLVVVEVPDCARSLESVDCTVLWEEHSLYLTMRTLPGLLSRAGLEFVCTERYAYPIEDSLVAVGRVGAHAPDGPPQPPSGEELQRLRRFAGALPGRREAWRRHLDEWRGRGPVALFGAGHLSCTFLSVMEVAERIAFVVDDNPHKQGMFMPGSGTPIRSSEALLDEGVSLCLLGAGAESEEAIVRNNRAFLDRGGTMQSIFPASARAAVLG